MKYMKRYGPSSPPMNKEELREYLAIPYLMDIATISPTGYPHVTPVWFDYDGECFLVSTLRERQKTQNLLKNPKAGFSIAQPDLPYAAVIGYGDISIEEDPGEKFTMKVTYKYITPPEKAEAYFKELTEGPGTRVILKIKPRWLFSWR